MRKGAINMKNTEINVTVENVEEVASKLKGLIENHVSNDMKLEMWIWEVLEDMKDGFYSEGDYSQKLRAIEYINEHKELMLSMVSNRPTYVRFSAEIGIKSLLEYGSPFGQQNNFAKSYDIALRQLQQTFRGYGYEFSEVIFTSVDDGTVTLIWETNKPVLFKDVLDYPKSLMTLADLLDQLDIFGLEFSYSYHLIGPLSNEVESNCYVGQGFKQGYFKTYDDSDCHLVQECPFDFTGFIHYSLDGSYHLSLEEEINEESLQLVLQSGYHLEGHQLRSGLNGVIKSVETIDW